jgi:hypothetical protein
VAKVIDYVISGILVVFILTVLVLLRRAERRRRS